MWFLQVLSTWKEKLSADYTVDDFMDQILDWYNEGYLEDKVWERLKKRVSPKVLDCNQDSVGDRQIALGEAEQDTAVDKILELIPVHQDKPVLVTVGEEKSQLRTRPETVISTLETTDMRSKHCFNKRPFHSNFSQKLCDKVVLLYEQV